MAEVEEKPKEAPTPSDNTNTGGDSKPADTREFMSPDDAKKEQERKNDLGAEQRKATADAADGAAMACNACAGDYATIAKDKAVRDSVNATKTKDGTAKLDKDGNGTFETKNLYGDPLGDLSKGKGGADKIALAKSLGLSDAGDKTKEVKSGKVEHNKPGDNNVRDIDPAKDNPEAVTKRYNDMVDSQNLKPEEAARLKKDFGENMAKMQEKFKGDDMAHISRSMNLMMDQGNHLQNDRNRINAVSGLAARGAEPQEANRQGANPTCALTSQSRVEQQRDFVKYADQMGSVAAKGGAWRGGENGTKPTWVNVDQAGTNHANFAADGEASRMYNKDYHQAAGKRDYLGQLDNALIGQEMAQYAGKRDGKDYVYVSANAQKVEGSDALRAGQGAGGNTLLERGQDGRLAQSRDGGQATNSPPSTLDMVAKVNHANGGGGLLVQENMAAQFRGADGKLPPGMVSFKDAADLKQQLSANPGKEFQIATNGVIVAGREGHGLHAQTVQLNKDGQLEFGNNWDDANNHKVYSDDFVNKFTNPQNWDNYSPQNRNPDGSPNWRDERVGPKTDTDSMTKPGENKNEDKDKKEKEEKDKADKDKEAKEKEKEEERQKQDKQRALQKAQADFDQEHSAWAQRKAAFEAKNEDAVFSEAEPVFKGAPS